MANTSSIRQAAWTFSIDSDCIYCGKTCRRVRTFYARTWEEATEQAEAATLYLSHKKCGGE